MADGKRRRVDWKPEEIEVVFNGIMKVLMEHPEYSVTEMFRLAQEGLPAQRRRPITAFSSAQNILDMVRVRFADMARAYAAAGGGGVPVVAPTNAAVAELRESVADLRTKLATANSDLDAAVRERDQLRAEVGRLQAELAAAPAKTIAALSTETLLTTLIGRCLNALVGERQRLEQNLVAELAGRIDAQRRDADQRLFGIEAMFSNRLAGGNTLPPAPTADVNAYMPLVSIAGLQRAEFQRLQSALIKANLRVQSVDPDKALKQHDVLFVWSRGVTTPVLDKLRTASRRVVVCETSLVDLERAIVDQARLIREERLAANGSV